MDQESLFLNNLYRVILFMYLFLVYWNTCLLSYQFCGFEGWAQNNWVLCSNWNQGVFPSGVWVLLHTSDSDYSQNLAFCGYGPNLIFLMTIGSGRFCPLKPLSGPSYMSYFVSSSEHGCLFSARRIKQGVCRCFLSPFRASVRSIQR